MLAPLLVVAVLAAAAAGASTAPPPPPPHYPATDTGRCKVGLTFSGLGAACGPACGNATALLDFMDGGAGSFFVNAAPTNGTLVTLAFTWHDPNCNHTDQDCAGFGCELLGCSAADNATAFGKWALITTVDGDAHPRVAAVCERGCPAWHPRCNDMYNDPSTTDASILCPLWPAAGFAAAQTWRRPNSTSTVAASCYCCARKKFPCGACKAPTPCCQATHSPVLPFRGCACKRAAPQCQHRPKPRKSDDVHVDGVGAAGASLLPPLRAPATPLFVHSPYVNWLLPADNATGDWVWHVRNDKVGSMTAVVRVDGKAQAILGPLGSSSAAAAAHRGQCPAAIAIEPMQQRGPPTILPTRTRYSFESAAVQVNLSFASPKFMEEMESWLPVALLQVGVSSADRKPHDVQVFFELSGQMAVDKDTQNISWARDSAESAGSDSNSMRIWHTDGVPLNEDNLPLYHGKPRGQPAEHLDWGSYHLSPLGSNVHTWAGSSNVARGSFAATGKLPTADETEMPVPACKGGVCRCGAGGRGADNDWPTLAAAWSFPAVGARAQLAKAVLSVDDLGASGRYFGTVMPEYWRKDGRTFKQMLSSVTSGFDALMQTCGEYDAAMVGEMKAAGGEGYARIGALSYRQVLGDNSLLWFPGAAGARGEPPSPPAPFMFVKGLGSSGDTGTIDDNYPASLFYLWKQPELLNALLMPINLYQTNHSFCESCGWPRNTTWPHPYSIHYLGQYPIAELQCWGNGGAGDDSGGPGHCEDMPLEMTADNLQMTAAAAFVSKNFSTVETFWPLLTQYADYLVKNGLRPTEQLCSDDFEGPSPLNANLAAKAIVGIATYAALCDATNRRCGAVHMATAHKYAMEWTKLSAGGRGGASKRDYGDIGKSWSQKYNLIWDRVFGFKLFDAAIERECTMIMAQDYSANRIRQKFGWFLDDRSETDKRHLTNAGWSEWTAAMCGQTAVDDLYSRILTFSEQTPDRWALTDYANAVTGARVGFEGRAQMGGFGATVLLKMFPKGLLHIHNNE